MKTQTVGSPELTAKADQIWELHLQSKQRTNDAIDAAKEAAMKAWEAGVLLLEVRTQLKHGEFLTWLKHEMPSLSRPTAYRYIRLAKALPTRENMQAEVDEACGSLTAIYRKVGALGRPKKSDSPGVEPKPVVGESGKDEIEAGDPLAAVHSALASVERSFKKLEKSLVKFPEDEFGANETQWLLSGVKTLLRIADRFGVLEEILGYLRSSDDKPAAEDMPDAA